MSTRHLRTDWNGMKRPTLKQRILKALSEPPWCLSAHDICEKVQEYRDCVAPNLSQMMRENPPKIERYVVNRKFVYILKD
jgi:hypothetical protein